MATPLRSYNATNSSQNPSVSEQATSDLERLRQIIRERSFGRGEITLSSGKKSDFYFNMKSTMLDPEGAALVARLTLRELQKVGAEFVGGLEMGAVPIAGAIAQLSWMEKAPISAFFVRKKPKEHGAKLLVEGLANGQTLKGVRVAIVDDVCTTGGSALKAVDEIIEAGGEVVALLTIVDREEGAAELFRSKGLNFIPLCRASEFLHS